MIFFPGIKTGWESQGIDPKLTSITTKSLRARPSLIRFESKWNKKRSPTAIFSVKGVHKKTDQPNNEQFLQRNPLFTLWAQKSTN